MPRTPLSAASAVSEDELDRVLERIRVEISQTVSAAIRATTEPSDVRLTRARACLDRLWGIREDVNGLLDSMRHWASTTAWSEEETLTRAVDHASAGSTGEERAARRKLSALGVIRTSRFAASYLRRAEQLQRDVRDAQFYVDGHRMEALTLLRAELRISEAEYYVFTD